MDKRQLIAIAKRTIDDRRFRAEYDCEKTLTALRKTPEYKQCETALRRAQIQGNSVDIAKYKDEMHALMLKLNVDERMLKPQYFCTNCGDTGYVENEMCACLKNELNKLLVSQSNIINKDYTFENSAEKDKHNSAVLSKARELAQSGDKNLLLTGSTGTGKTYLVTACANCALKLNRSVLFVTAYDLNSRFLEAHLADHKTKQSVLDSIVDADVLIIDDLGTELVYKNVTAEYLFVVINERIAKNKQTIISTNLSLADLRDRYDERLFSRLVDQSVTFVAQLTGKDKRIVK